MQVVIDGTTYVPADESDTCVGVAVTTRNRPDVLAKTLEQIRRHTPGAKLVVVDDASDTPVDGADFRFEQQAGIARAKNKCLELLDDCEHIFLFDDDCYPIADDWYRPYVESPEHHLMYTWGEEHFRTSGLVGYLWPKGCMLYADSQVLSRVGGMDPVFGVWGLEHLSWSDRIHNAGLTTCRYQDVPGSEKLLASLDRSGNVESCVPLAVRRKANVAAAEAFRDSDAFVPYRATADDVTRVALSVLVPSVSSRRETFAPKIMDQLFGQHEMLSPENRRRVEILILTDAKGVALGTKRNDMIRIARGEYVAFVDDDDRVSEDYLATLLSATDHGADVITFLASVSLDGAAPKTCRYSLKYEADKNTSSEYHRIPNHLSAVRRELAVRTPYTSLGRAEDAEYAKDLRPLLRSEHHIDRTLYYYDYDSATTVAQRPSRIEEKKRPTVDVVILSKADTAALRAMTQHTVSTCLAGAGAHAVNVVVMEQVSGVRYRDAVTIYKPEPFAYNRFANEGIHAGSAEWVMVANNDLEFGDGWLQGLLAANHELVSPVCPNESRQNRLTENESGHENGKHLSGWCFMMKRTLWEKIGGLDEDFVFWCADDSLIEQARTAGVPPMAVPGASVTHLISQTVGGRGHAADDPSDGAMTWAMVRRFNEKFGANKFGSDARYLAWQRANPEMSTA